MEIAGQLSAALEAAHAAGVVHRDLKPSNIRLTPEGIVKVLDFGLAKILENAALHRDHPPTFQTSIGSLLGTAPYMAPEQLFGREVDARTDQFALGVVLYQMATGEVPFSGRNIVEVLQAVSNKAPRAAEPAGSGAAAAARCADPAAVGQGAGGEVPVGGGGARGAGRGLIAVAGRTRCGGPRR